MQGNSRITDIENIMWTWQGREEREGEMYEESNMETYNTIYKIDSQWELVVWLRKLKQVLYHNPEEWDGAGDGKEV